MWRHAAAQAHGAKAETLSKNRSIKSNPDSADTSSAVMRNTKAIATAPITMARCTWARGISLPKAEAFALPLKAAIKAIRITATVLNLDASRH